MPDWLYLLVVFPAVCGIIGWFTNVVAVKMIFRPYERLSLLGLSFQGVLPKNQAHFARELAKVVTRDFVTTDDLVAHVDPPRVLEDLEPMMRQVLHEVLEEVRGAVDENKRALFTPAFTEAMMDHLLQDVRRRVPELMAELRQRSSEAVDLEELIAQKIVAIGPRRLEEIIYQVSRKELRFIEWYGGVFGLALGLLQWLVLQAIGDVALPVVGAVVGIVTNWLAIQMLFYPREPSRILGFTYQGLFPKRQHEIARSLGEIAAREFIVPREIFGLLADRVIPPHTTVVELRQVEETLRNRAPHLAQMGDALLSPDEQETLRRRMVERYPDLVPRVKAALVESASRHVDVNQILTVKIQALSRSAFEGLLRGLFEREEWYLLVYGGLLGGLVGLLQLAIVYWTA